MWQVSYQISMGEIIYHRNIVISIGFLSIAILESELVIILGGFLIKTVGLSTTIISCESRTLTKTD
jgi:membrane protein DedA with SNARE-associated domain